MTTVSSTDLTFSLREGETLLEGLERTGHDVEFQCRSGYCGSCRMNLVEGEVQYQCTPLAFVGPGEILPCCCTAAAPVKVECWLQQPQTADD